MCIWQQKHKHVQLLQSQTAPTSLCRCLPQDKKLCPEDNKEIPPISAAWSLKKNNS